MILNMVMDMELYQIITRKINILRPFIKMNNVYKQLKLGFIGNDRMARYYVRAVDIKKPEFSPTLADDFIIYDLTNTEGLEQLFMYEDSSFDEIYQRCNMGVLVIFSLVITMQM